jgi:hypothetical protein
MEVDMSSEAITQRLKRLSELRDLCMSLKLAGKKAGLHSDGVTKHEDDNTVDDLIYQDIK